MGAMGGHIACERKSVVETGAEQPPVPVKYRYRKATLTNDNA
jgi:hypothetical protein